MGNTTNNKQTTNMTTTMKDATTIATRIVNTNPTHTRFAAPPLGKRVAYHHALFDQLIQPHVMVFINGDELTLRDVARRRSVAITPVTNKCDLFTVHSTSTKGSVVTVLSPRECGKHIITFINH